MKKNEYLTKPRKLLKEFLNKNPDQKFTVKQIFEGLGGELSLSSVYRNLEALEKQGLIKRFAGKGWEGIYFQYILSDTCKDFLHITCTKCGKTVHASQKVSGLLEKSLSECEDFYLDKKSTTLQGICKDCLN